MSRCITNCSLCKNLVISQAITFTDGNLVVNLPQMSFSNGCKYCIVFAQSIPDTTTVNAPVVFTIGTGTTNYQFLNKCCAPVLASQIRTRKKYKVCVSTSETTGVFKYIGDCPLPTTSVTAAQSIPVPTDTTPAT